MTRLIKFLFICCCCPISASAQFITAGESEAVDFYHDFIPDTSLISYHGPNQILHFPIDMDNDFVADFSFNLKDEWGAQGYQNVYVRLIAHNGNQIAWAGITDTCFDNSIYPIAQSFEVGDTINDTELWTTDSILYLDFRKLNVQAGDCQNGIGDAGIIGVRLIGLTDTVYGWIGFHGNESHTNGSKLFVEAIASGHQWLTVEELTTKHRVYPNPCKNRLHLEIDGNLRYDKVDVYSQLGKLLISRKTSNTLSTIDVSKMKSGIYYYKLTSKRGQEFVFGKFIIQKE